MNHRNTYAQQLSLLDSMMVPQLVQPVSPDICEKVSVNAEPIPAPTARVTTVAVLTTTGMLTATVNINDTLQDYGIYLSSAHKKESTILLFTADLRKLSEFLPGKPIGSIIVTDLRRFIDDCRKKDRPKTVARRISALRNYFKWLYTDKVIADNPAASLIYPRPVAPLPEILSRDEVAAFLEAARVSDEDHMIATLFLGAGLKRGEALMLTANSIKIEEPLHSQDLPRATATVGGSGYHNHRICSLPLDSVECFRGCLSKLHPEDQLLSMTPRKLNQIVSDIGKRAKIKSVTCQQLRDTFAVQLLRSGQEISDVMDALGLLMSPANDDIIQKYSKLYKLNP